MSDAALEAKFRGLVDGILAPAETERLMTLCWNIGGVPDIAEVARAAVPTASVGA
jgi:hypothetical protein